MSNQGNIVCTVEGKISEDYSLAYNNEHNNVYRSVHDVIAAGPTQENHMIVWCVVYAKLTENQL